MKVLSCIGRPSQDGTKTYYSVALEKADGSQIGAFSFEAVNPGDMVEDSRIIPSKREGEWTLKSAPKAGGKSWPPKDDNRIVAQCAAKMVCDLVIAGKINPVKMSDYQENFIIMAKAIKATAAAIKDPAAPAVTKPTSAAPKSNTDFDGLHQEPNLIDLENMDWSKETQKSFLDTLVIVARHLKWEPQNVKTFLVEKFQVADSRGITIAMRNDVMKALIAEVKL